MIPADLTDELIGHLKLVKNVNSCHGVHDKALEQRIRVIITSVWGNCLRLNLQLHMRP